MRHTLHHRGLRSPGLHHAAGARDTQILLEHGGLYTSAGTYAFAFVAVQYAYGRGTLSAHDARFRFANTGLLVDWPTFTSLILGSRREICWMPLRGDVRRCVMSMRLRSMFCDLVRWSRTSGGADALRL